MSKMEGHGRLFQVVPIAAGNAVSLVGAAGVTFVVTGNDTFTVTTASTFGGSYATPGAIIDHYYTSTATNGTAAWAKQTQAAGNAVTIASGAASFYVGGDSLPDTKKYVKVSVGGSGLVFAILHDLVVQRTPANLAIVGA